MGLSKKKKKKTDHILIVIASFKVHRGLRHVMSNITHTLSENMETVSMRGGQMSVLYLLLDDF